MAIFTIPAHGTAQSIVHGAEGETLKCYLKLVCTTLTNSEIIDVFLSLKSSFSLTLLRISDFWTDTNKISFLKSSFFRAMEQSGV
jgi:hypothetical protein